MCCLNPLISYLFHSSLEQLTKVVRSLVVMAVTVMVAAAVAMLVRTRGLNTLVAWIH